MTTVTTCTPYAQAAPLKTLLDVFNDVSVSQYNLSIRGSDGPPQINRRRHTFTGKRFQSVRQPRPGDVDQRLRLAYLKLLGPNWQRPPCATATSHLHQLRGLAGNSELLACKNDLGGLSAGLG